MKSGYLNQLEKHGDLLADRLFAAAFKWLRENPSPIPREEPYPILGDDVSARVIEFTPELPEQGKFETHHEFVDLQVNLGPNPERIGLIDASQLKVSEDRPDGKDVTHYETPTPHFPSDLLYVDQFMIFDVEADAHMPQRIMNSKAAPGEHIKARNRKVVIKLCKSALTPGLQL
jgi:beta-galactosidase beta subunit